MPTYKDLKVYQNSLSLVTDIYLITGEFPKNEIYGLTNQIRRCAVSIPSNISEGSVRNSLKENIRFLNIALGSACEIDTQIQIASNLGYITDQTFESFSLRIEGIIKMLNGMIRYKKSLIEVKPI